MIHLVWELYDGQTHKDECAEVLSTAYSYNNPFMAPLKLNKQDLKQDFLLQLDSKIFKWIFIFFDGELYHQGIKEIVGVTCAGEMLDFQTPHELNESQNFDMVPSPQLVRTYMRYKTLKPFWEKMQNIQKNEYFYVGNTGITPKYMGRGIVSYYMVLEIISYLKYQGYKYAVSNAINSIAKRFIGRLSNVLQEKVTLEEMHVVSDKSQPFKNTGLTQVLFVGEVEDGIRQQVFWMEDFKNLGNKLIIGVSCANDMQDFLKQHQINQDDGLQNPFLKQNAFYALWAKAKNVQQNEFFYMGDIAISLECRSREIVFYKMMIKITQYFQRCGFIYGIVKGLKPINNEIFNKNDVFAIPENSEVKETQGKKQILYAGKTEFLSNTFQNLLIQAQPKL